MQLNEPRNTHANISPKGCQHFFCFVFRNVKLRYRIIRYDMRSFSLLNFCVTKRLALKNCDMLSVLLFDFQPGEGGQEGLAEYLARYRHFSEQFSGVVRTLGCDQLEASQAEIVTQQLNTLENLISKSPGKIIS